MRAQRRDDFQPMATARGDPSTRISVRSAETDDGHQAAAARAFLAIAEEKIRAAGGAEITRIDVLSGDACFEKLRAIGGAKIEADVFRRRLVAGRQHVQPLEGIGLIAGAKLIEPIGGIRKLRLERAGDFRAHFITATADGWAHGGHEVLGARAVLHVHAAEGLLDNAPQSAAPAGVNGGNGAAARIGKKNRHAIGRLDAEE